MKNDSYQKIVGALKRHKKGSTIADVSAATALSLPVVRELLPKAVDEYCGHLQVTQSGEILYTFPNGFSSRYRGLGAVLKRAVGSCFNAVKAAAVFFFKAWIMVMLVGYFVLFITLALALVALSMFAQSRSSGRGRRNVSFGGVNLFSLMWRMWFIDAMMRPYSGHSRQAPARQNKKGRPMHKAIFSFVFGEADPNKEWEDQKDKAVISYIQSNNGVISLAEYMAFSSDSSLEAEESILSFCARFGGSPEVTEEGTIVYRFDELLLRANSRSHAELSPPVKQLKTFSANPKKLNTWFVIINAVNLIFGSYFLHHSLATGLLVYDYHYQAASMLYSFTHALLSAVTLNPVPFLTIGLGIIPLVFSLFFWVIPAIRRFMEQKENERIKLSNFKRFSFSKIWSSPLNINFSRLAPSVDECRPKDMAEAGGKVLKELGALSNPDVNIDSKGETLYSFSALEDEKRALTKYRGALDPRRAELGKTVFDSDGIDINLQDKID